MSTVEGPVLVVGATGFLGRHVVRRLRGLGLDVTVAARSPAEAGLGPRVGVVAWDGASPFQWDGRPRTVVNLAGATVAGKRWTPAYKALLRRSRIDLTRHLVAWMRDTGAPVRALVNASAVGYYGSDPEGPLPEESPVGDDFLAQLCFEWEAAAAEAEPLGARRVSLRFGVLLGRGGGALERLEPIYRAGAGGPIGRGRFPFAWCHVEDAARAVLFAAATPPLQGAVNVVAPEPATYADFSRALAGALHRPNLAPVPPPMLRLLFGESASALTGGQRAVPRRLEEAGFTWRHPRLTEALKAVYATPEDASPVVDVRAGTLDHRMTLDAPLEEVWRFFSDPRNLDRLTPPRLGFDAGPVPADVGKGTVLTHTLKLGPVRTRWASRLTEWDPPHHFQDTQEEGPYAQWVHDHRFEAVGERTRVTDHVSFALPLGALGRLGGGGYVRHSLEAVFTHRHCVLESLFGVVEA